MPSLEIHGYIFKLSLLISDMPKITFHGEKTVEIATDKTILETSLSSGIPHTHVCGGNARCSTCRVFILDGLENCMERNEKEKALAERRKFEPRIRLACQTKVSGDVTCKRLVKDEDDIAMLSQEIGPEHACTGQEKRLVIYFSDLRGFTTFSENNLPYDVVHVLNKYFTKLFNKKARILSGLKSRNKSILIEKLGKKDFESAFS